MLNPHNWLRKPCCYFLLLLLNISVQVSHIFTCQYGSKGLERVMLEPVSLDAAGVYKCEVMADQTFHTVSQQANMTVVCELVYFLMNALYACELVCRTSLLMKV
jgi:hypothetical protein